MPPFVTDIAARLLGLYINLLSFFAPVKANAIAYKYFSQPLYGRLNKNKLPIILREAVPVTLQHEGIGFQAYVWPGNATTVLLAHGWESNAARWKLLISYLRKSGCTIVAVDAPAHGLSDGKEFTIPRYAAYINVAVLKYRPQYLVGHSLGGATALYFQAHYPNPFIKKLVVLGAPSEFYSILKNYSKKLGFSKAVYNRLLAFCTDCYGMDLNDFSGAAFAKKITIPGLIVHDRGDKTVAYKEGKLIGDAYPNSTFITTNGMGHRLHDDGLYTKIYDYLFNDGGETHKG
ncbi:alpha/beta fold hydrolase [Flavobacterium sp. RHBU_24]|uniref:alpha/beta fold hydrolase n=1 Tax=Flavobacterium sp. RHBU_24 TaxID=3391185 RepID=UPI00398499D3